MVRNISHFIDSDITVSQIHLALQKKCPVNWRFEQKSSRGSHGVVYVLNGGATYYISNGVYSVKKYDIFFLVKGSKYLTIGNTDTPYNYIVVNFDLAEDESIDILPMNDISSAKNFIYYESAFHELANTWFYKGIAYKLKCKAILQDILFHMVKDMVENQMSVKDFSRIQPAVDYMENYYNRPIKISELSEMINLSVSHFRRLFKDIYGISPLEYLNNIRINKAKDLIMGKMHSIGEIAERTGYNNIYYFSRVFKKITGESPTEFSRRA